jgi:hypothetical protein
LSWQKSDLGYGNLTDHSSKTVFADIATRSFRKPDFAGCWYALSAQDSELQMVSEYRCLCGRLWILGRHTPDLARSGRMVCRCSKLLHEDGDGSWHADLIEPLEKFAPLRRVTSVIGLTLLRLAKKLSIPLSANSRPTPKNLARLRSLNRALHFRVQVSVHPHQ